MKSIYSTLAYCFLFLSTASFSQDNLERYIQEGLGSNETIKQQKFLLDKSLYALREAKSLFLPSVSFSTNYYLSGGGRTIDFPLGDLLNSAYSTLNQLTHSTSFPQLQNQSILLNPNKFYDAKFRTTLPLLNFEIEYNRRIRSQQVGLQQIEVDIYKRELVRQIKLAYFNYLQAEEAIKIYKNALNLANENLRINTVLLKNDKTNRTSIIRSENEVTKYQSLIEVAAKSSESAAAFFNFLLNKPLATRILKDSISYLSDESVLQDTLISNREEVEKVRGAYELNKQVLGLSKSYIIPKLSTFIDLGSQGFQEKFNDKTRYYFFGLSLQWDLFSSGRNTYKVKQVEIDSKIIQSRVSYVESQLQLQLTTAINAFKATKSQYQAALKQQSASERYYNDILKLYRIGQLLLIELLDAHNQLITAQLQANIARFDMWAKAAEIERANASFNIK